MMVAKKKNPHPVPEKKGAGNGTDRCFSPDTVPSDIGLLKNNSWPLKEYVTCVKNQASRGTCVAFGSIAAIECKIAEQYKEWVNFSEQDFFKHFKLDWVPVPADYYGDGYSTLTALNKAVANKYVFVYEKSWNYNPSKKRVKDDADRTYAESCETSGSCGPVSANCSDTNHQAKKLCFNIPAEIVKWSVKKVARWIENPAGILVDDTPGLFGPDLHLAGRWVEENVSGLVTETALVQTCIYETDIRHHSGYYVYSGISLIDPSGIEKSLNMAKTFLNCKYPIAMSFHSVPSFKTKSVNNGYVTYRGTTEEISGGHCVFLNGYISNDHIPKGAPKAAGGGYFIIKNSWSTSYGDCGYAYLPYDWVKQWCAQLVAYTYIGKV